MRRAAHAPAAPVPEERMYERPSGPIRRIMLLAGAAAVMAPGNER